MTAEIGETTTSQEISFITKASVVPATVHQEVIIRTDFITHVAVSHVPTGVDHDRQK